MPISSHQAQTAIDGAEGKAREMGLPVIVAVLDAGAHLKAFRRMDGAVLGSIDIAIRKATHGRPVPGQQRGRLGVLQAGRPGARPRAHQWRPRPVRRRHPAQGSATAQLIGALGVSGGTVAQDVEVAQAGLAAFKP